MQVILGPFHPHLEDRLVEEILRHKQADPLCPLLVLVPSDSLRRRLKVLLAGERRVHLLNIHLMTFYQLSRRLYEESHGRPAADLCDDAFLEEVLRQLLRMRLPGADSFAALEEKAGGSAALWQTLRDLKDGAVNPATVLEAAEGDLFGEESTEGARGLFTLFQTFLSCCEKWHFRDYSDLDRAALAQVPSSAYLKQFQHIFYYGFYDLTQVQLDVFQSVAGLYPATVFFPLVRQRPPQPAWTFAERFYERYVHGLASVPSSTHVDSQAAMPERRSSLALFAEGRTRPRPAAWNGVPVTIFSCFDRKEEIDTAAKEILRLVSEKRCAFEEIGVVGRVLDGYLPWIKEIFSRHSIPLTTSGQEPLTAHPLAKAALLLLHLPLKNYLRSHVIDLLDSPFFDAASRASGEAAPRPDLWDLATRQIGVTKGIEEWRRLESYLDSDLVAAGSMEEESELRTVTVSAEQLRSLWRLFRELHGDLESLPKEASWSRYVELWKELQEKWLALDFPAADPASPAPKAAEALAEILEQLSRLGVVAERISLTHFLETYRRWIERRSVSFLERNVRGVAVLDTMTARGIPFRALFVIGLNEGVFPRSIREDAFLRDRERNLLETVLGYKVATKLGGFDEERLLFTLLVGAAHERLYCLHPRNDESGRPLATSWYLEELCDVLGEEGVKKIVVPRGAVEKSNCEPFNDIALLPPEELAVRLILTAEAPEPVIDLCLPTPSLYRRGSEAIVKLEGIINRLTEHDGLVGDASDGWKRIAEQGLSATLLEAYARCPFQFFARNLLRLERLERPEEITGPAPAEIGEIVHSILRAFYQELADRGFFQNTGVDSAPILAAAIQKAFSTFERRNPVGYPVAWEIRREEIAALLEQAVALDLQELQASGFKPIAFERDAASRVPESWPDPLSGIAIRGRMDRIDHQPEMRRYRVIDYKLKLGKSRAEPDKDLLRSALRGQRLQPPLYLLLGREAVSPADVESGKAGIDAAFYFLAPRWAEGALVVERLADGVWEGQTGRSLVETVASLAAAIRAGLFFVQPGEHCRYCEVSEVCRRNHRPTMWRIGRDARSRSHAEIKQKRVPS